MNEQNEKFNKEIENIKKKKTTTEILQLKNNWIEISWDFQKKNQWPRRIGHFKLSYQRTN